MPTDIVNGFSDDQIALIGCFVSLIVTGTIMSLSYYIGAKGRSENSSADAQFLPLSRIETSPADDARLPEYRDAA